MNSMKENRVEIYKSGTFFNVYGDGGLILYALLGYKYIEPKKTVGFPASALSKVRNALENSHISYIVYDKSTILGEYKGINKNYKKYINEALKSLEIEKRLNRLTEIINQMSLKELEKLIEIIENGKF